MRDNPSQKRDDKTYSAYPISLRDSGFEVGSFNSADAIDAPANRGTSFGWFLTEYITGPMFVVISWTYTFLVPSSVTSLSDLVYFFRSLCKRGVDIVGSIIGLALSVPLFVCIAIIIKLDSPGSVFYSQVRVGHERRRISRRAYKLSSTLERRRRDRRQQCASGRLFSVYKFRTMVTNAESVTGPVWATKHDSRITRFGRFLRRSRLDELPQLLNVLKGEMSLVGPRPERPMFVEKLADELPGYHRRLSVRPGLTGLAQVENGYDVSVDSVAEKLKTDLRYIDSWTVTADMKILLRTIWVVLSGRGAN